MDTNDVEEPAPKRRRIQKDDTHEQGGDLEVLFQHQQEVRKIAVDAMTSANKANVCVLSIPTPIALLILNPLAEQHCNVT